MTLRQQSAAVRYAPFFVALSSQLCSCPPKFYFLWHISSVSSRLCYLLAVVLIFLTHALWSTQFSPVTPRRYTTISSHLSAKVIYQLSINFRGSGISIPQREVLWPRILYISASKSSPPKSAGKKAYLRSVLINPIRMPNLWKFLCRY